MTNTEETTPELTWRASRQHSAPQSSRAGAAARSGGTSLRPAPCARPGAPARGEGAAGGEDRQRGGQRCDSSGLYLQRAFRKGQKRQGRCLRPLENEVNTGHREPPSYLEDSSWQLSESVGRGSHFCPAAQCHAGLPNLLTSTLATGMVTPFTRQGSEQRRE